MRGENGQKSRAFTTGGFTGAEDESTLRCDSKAALGAVRPRREESAKVTHIWEDCAATRELEARRKGKQQCVRATT